MAKHYDCDRDGLADRQRSDFTQDDGSSYSRVDPSEFESFDEVDSRTIVDPGEPSDS